MPRLRLLGLTFTSKRRYCTRLLRLGRLQDQLSDLGPAGLDVHAHRKVEVVERQAPVPVGFVRHLGLRRRRAVRRAADGALERPTLHPFDARRGLARIVCRVLDPFYVVYVVHEYPLHGQVRVVVGVGRQQRHLEQEPRRVVECPVVEDLLEEFWGSIGRCYRVFDAAFVRVEQCPPVDCVEEIRALAVGQRRARQSVRVTLLRRPFRRRIGLP